MGCRLLTGYSAVGTRLLCYWVRPRRLDVSSLSRLKGARAMTSKHEDIDLQSEVAKQLDLSVIRYSRVWEDHRTLSQGLQIREDQDVVVSITSSGDNTLNLLLDRPKAIVAVDMSPAQNALFELKLGAITHLDYEDYLCLLGETEDSSKQRLKLYHEIRDHLPAYAQEYWDSHSEVLEVGVWSCSRLEQYIATYHDEHLPKVVSREEIDGFLAAKSLEEQRSLFEKLPLDKIGELHQWYTGKEQQTKGRSHAQLKYVDMSDKDVGASLWRRFSEVCRTIPVQDNFYLSWWLRGRRGFNPDSNPMLAPPFLTRDGFSKLKGLVDRVQVYTGTLEDYLNQPNLPKINKANLSDLFEYMSEEASDVVFTALADKMAAGGRIAYWNLFVDHYPPPALLQSKLTHLKQLSTELHKTDRVFYYTDFCVLQVN